MYYNNSFSNNFFTKGHRALTWGTVLLGGSLFLLAILIFAYPALIAYFIAALILFAGLAVLTVGLSLGKFRNQITQLDKMEDIPFEPYHYRSSSVRHPHITFFRW